MSRIIIPDFGGKPNKQLQREQARLLNEIGEKRGKILDDFARAYLAQKQVDLDQVMLVQKQEALSVKFFFATRPAGYPTESDLMRAALNMLKVFSEAKKSKGDDQAREAAGKMNEAAKILETAILRAEKLFEAQRLAALPNDQEVKR